MNIEEFRARGMLTVTESINRMKGKNKPRLKAKNPSTEKATQQACMELLTAKRIFHYRQNTGAMKTEGGRFIRYGATGSPDIIAVIGGKYIGIEVKDVHGKQSPGQIEFQKQLEGAGGVYMVIRSIDELIAYLESHHTHHSDAGRTK